MHEPTIDAADTDTDADADTDTDTGTGTWVVTVATHSNPTSGKTTKLYQWHLDLRLRLCFLKYEHFRLILIPVGLWILGSLHGMRHARTVRRSPPAS